MIPNLVEKCTPFLLTESLNHLIHTNFQVLPTEVRTIERAISNDPTSLYKGVTIAGEEHTYLSCEPGFSVICCSEKAGFIIIKTLKCIIICEYSGDVNSGMCYANLQNLAEQLRIHDF